MHALGTTSQGSKFRISEFHSDALLAHVMAKAGIFPSVSQARKNGWDRPIEIGSWFVGKRKSKWRSRVGKLADFYAGIAPTSSGLFFEDFLEMTDDELEECHDFIQWVFPLPVPSKFNPDAPLLTNDELEKIKRSNNIEAAFTKMMNFYGLGYSDRSEVNPSKWKWVRKNDHNFLRLTRILRFLVLTGRMEEAHVLFQQLSILHQLTITDAVYANAEESVISERTMEFWKEAISNCGLAEPK